MQQRHAPIALAIFVSKQDGSILLDDEVDARIVAAMQKGGADAWWETPAQEFLGNAYKADYAPGSKGSLAIQVRDHQGKPVETELSLAMALTGSRSIGAPFAPRLITRSVTNDQSAVKTQ